MSGTVLFVTYGGGHIAKVAPVVKELEKSGIPCTVLALTVGFAAARRMGLSPIGYRDLLRLVDAPRAMQLGRRLIEGNRHPDVDEQESCAYLGINYLDWVERFGEEEAAIRYREGGRRSFLPLNFMGRVVDDLRPAVVVSTSSPRSEQAVVEAAATRGVPSLTMMDLFALPYDPYLRQIVRADRITVMSEFVKENLVKAGIEANRVRVTGCPAYDALLEPEHKTAALAFRDRLGWRGLKVVLWAGYLEEGGPSVPPEYEGAGFGVAVERRLRQWVAQHHDAALIVRYHPNQYHQFPNFGPQERVYWSPSPTEPPQPLLHACDVVVVQTSTIGLEASIIGKRVLNLAFAPSVLRLQFDYSRLGLGESVPDLEGLVPMLREHSPLRETPHILPAQGPAAPLVAAEILELIAPRIPTVLTK